MKRRLSIRLRGKAWVWVIAAVLVVAAAMVGVRLVAGARQAASQSLLATAAVQRGNLVVTVSGSGQVAPRDRRPVRAGLGGEVVSVAVEPGQRVKAGDPLVTLANDALLSQLDQARTDLQDAEARLVTTLGVPVDQAYTVDPAAALIVTAPADGVLTSFKLTPGDRVTQGATLGVVAAADQVAFITDVTRTEVELLKPGQEVNVELDQFSGYSRGRVASVDGQGRPGDTVVWHKVTVLLPNVGLLKAGMAGTLEIPFGADFIRRRGVTDWAGRTLVQGRATGTVEDVLVRDGDLVRRGQVLARLYSETFADDVESLRSRVTMARDALARCEEDVAGLVVKAPIDGTVLSVAAAAGDSVTAAMELVALGDLDLLVVTAAVDELDIAKVAEGQRAAITFDAISGRRFSGAVSFIALEGTAQSGVTTFDVDIEFPGDPAIRPGMTATVTIEVARKENVLLVPVEAVTGGRLVTIMTDKGTQPRQVQIGLQGDVMAEVLSGLREGEEVVLAMPDSERDQGFGMFRMQGGMSRPRTGAGGGADGGAGGGSSGGPGDSGGPPPGP